MGRGGMAIEDLREGYAVAIERLPAPGPSDIIVTYKGGGKHE